MTRVIRTLALAFAANGVANDNQTAATSSGAARITAQPTSMGDYIVSVSP